MIRSYLPRVVAANDLSGFGRVSLTESIPILSAMGVEVCPLPTAILSTHTYKFENYTFCDLTDEMEKILAHWSNLDIHFDAIVTGYMGSARQIGLLSGFIQSVRNKGESLIVIDPVLGDNDLSDVETVYYDRMNDLVFSMREFVKIADIITPNLTEACLLLGEPYPKTYLSKDELTLYLYRLADLGPKKIAITSVMTEKNKMCVCTYDRTEDKISFIDCGYVNRPFHGTGDIFTSVLTGAILQGKTMTEASHTAVKFIRCAIDETLKYPDHPIEFGVIFEKVLSAGSFMELSKQK